jgi:hypothetical protein
MAQILRGFSARRSGPAPIYPWKQWFDGQTRRIVHGVDFTCTWRSMVRNIRHAAKMRGLRVRVSTEPNSEPPAILILALDTNWSQKMREKRARRQIEDVTVEDETDAPQHMETR